MSGQNYRYLWWSHLWSTAGSSLSAGLFFMIAVAGLNKAADKVTAMAAIAAVLAAVTCIPVLFAAERLPNKAILVLTASLRAATSIALWLLLVFDGLALIHLAVGMALVTALSVFSGSLTTAEIRKSVPERQWLNANKSLSLIGWVCVALLTPLGGALFQYVGTATPLILNATCHLLAAVSLLGLRTNGLPPNVPHDKLPGNPSASHNATDPETTDQKTTDQERSEPLLRRLFGGWVFMWNSPTLRGYFINAMIFGGCLAASAPLVSDLVLKHLRLTPLHYSLLLSLPAFAGIAGTWCSTKIVAKIGEQRAIWCSGAARSIWLVLLPFAPHGTLGFSYLLLFECLLMFTAGVFNPIFATIRLRLVDSRHVRAVASAWPISAHLTKPFFIGLAAAAMATCTTKSTLIGVGIAMLVAIVFLPRACLTTNGTPESLPRQ